MNETIKFIDGDGNEAVFDVIEQTRVNNTDYLLIAEPESEEGEDESVALIVKDTSKPEDTEAVYEIVEDDNELEAVQKIFNELLDDYDIV